MVTSYCSVMICSHIRCNYLYYISRFIIAYSASAIYSLTFSFKLSEVSLPCTQLKAFFAHNNERLCPLFIIFLLFQIKGDSPDARLVSPTPPLAIRGKSGLSLARFSEPTQAAA